MTAEVADPVLALARCAVRGALPLRPGLRRRPHGGLAFILTEVASTTTAVHARSVEGFMVAPAGDGHLRLLLHAVPEVSIEPNS